MTTTNDHVKTYARRQRSLMLGVWKTDDRRHQISDLVMAKIATNIARGSGDPVEFRELLPDECELFEVGHDPNSDGFCDCGTNLWASAT
jgi:hypothetical protein